MPISLLQPALTTLQQWLEHTGLMTWPGRLLVWLPRVCGIAVAGFVSLFALDAFEPGTPLTVALGAYAVHLIPAVSLLIIVAIAWRRPWSGALAFLGLAVAYALSVPTHPDWIVAISGPLALVGVLYLWSWRHKPDRRAT